MKLVALLMPLALSVSLTACPPAGSPPPVPPSPAQQATDAAKLIGCIAGDVLTGKPILAIAVDCAGGAEQVVIDILADIGISFGLTLPAQYANDPRVQASMAKQLAAKLKK